MKAIKYLAAVALVMVAVAVSAGIQTGPVVSGGSANNNASLLTTGTLADGRLSTNVPTLNAATNIWSGAQQPAFNFQVIAKLPTQGVIVDSLNTTTTSDNSGIIQRASPAASGPSWILAYTGTNITNGTVYTTNSGVPYYYYDLYGSSFAIGGQQCLSTLNRGVAQIVQNYLPFAVTSTTKPGGLSAGNYPMIFMYSTSNMVFFEKTTSGKLRPCDTVDGSGGVFSGDGGPQTMIINETSGDVFIQNGLLTAKGIASTGITNTGGVVALLGSNPSSGVNIDAVGNVNICSVNHTNSGQLWASKFAFDAGSASVNGSSFLVDTSGDGIGQFAGAGGGLGLFTLADSATSPAIKIHNGFSGGAADVVTVKSNLDDLGTISALTGYKTLNTNQFAVASTGWTNTNALNCVMYITGATAATFTFSDGTNTIFTDTGLTFTTSETLLMHPSYKVVVSSGTITGVATVQ